MERFHLWVRQIEFHFEFGLKYKDIRSVFDLKHGFQISEQHLKPPEQLRVSRRQLANLPGNTVKLLHNKAHMGENTP